MRPEDRVTAAYAVKKSLEHVIDAASGKGTTQFNDEMTTRTSHPELNACTQFTLGYTVDDTEVKNDITETMGLLPIPGLIEGLGEMPRFRSELGLFVGFASAARFGANSGGFSWAKFTFIHGVDGILRKGRHRSGRCIEPIRRWRGIPRFRHETGCSIRCKSDR